jgi:hypothetical protein
MRCRLRTLLIVLALGPPVLALLWYALPQPSAHKHERFTPMPSGTEAIPVNDNNEPVSQEL